MNVLGMLIFQNFISRYENFKYRDSSSTRYLTPQSAWTTHLMHECCNTVDMTPCSCGWAAAPGKWSEGRGTGSCGGVKLQSAPVSHVLVTRETRPTDCYHPRLITRCGCNCSTMNSRNRNDGLGRVYSLESVNLNWLQMQC